VSKTVFTAIIAAALILCAPYAKSAMRKMPQGLPSQAGNTGKYLTTNGSVLSWGTVAAGSGDIKADGSVPFTGNQTWNAQADVRFADADSTNYAAIQAPATISVNYTLTLPTDDGAASQVLQTDGSGVLTWANPNGTTPATYTTNTTQAVADSTNVIVNFEDIEYDDCSPDCVTVGAAWKYTVPTGGDGVYNVCAKVTMASSSAWNAGELLELDLYKNGASIAAIDLKTAQASFTGIMAVNGCRDVRLVATDYVQINVIHTAGSSLNILNNGLSNFVSIKRVNL
jgi:hypothetical protein